MSGYCIKNWIMKERGFLKCGTLERASKFCMLCDSGNLLSFSVWKTLSRLVVLKFRLFLAEKKTVKADCRLFTMTRLFFFVMIIDKQCLNNVFFIWCLSHGSLNGV